MTTPNPRVYCRPYTHPAIKVPTYPTITQSHHILEMTWEQRMKALENDRQRIR
jgi:hypothetical protein